MIVILIAIILLTKLPLWYAVSLPGFVLGIWFCKFERKLTSANSRLQTLTMCALGISWFVFWQWNTIFSTFIPQYRYALIASFIAPCAFTLTVVAYIGRATATPPHLRVYRSSYEVYLLQHGAMMIVSPLTNSFPVYWIATMLTVTVMAMIIHKLNGFLLCKIMSFKNDSPIYSQKLR